MASKRDREKLKTRVKAALERSGRTQKQLESEIGWPSGTLSRVFSGKKGADPELLTALSDRLGVPVPDLCSGTSYANLWLEDATVEVVADWTVESEPATLPGAEPAPIPGDEAPVAAEASLASKTEAAAERSAPLPADAGPEPSDRPGPADPAADRGPRPEWTPPPEPRKRKRDLPFRLLRWVARLVAGG